MRQSLHALKDVLMNITRRKKSPYNNQFNTPVFLLSFLVLLISIWPSNAPAPALTEVSREEQIPKVLYRHIEIPRNDSIPRNYKTWSLFLVCSQSWLSSTDKNLDELFRNYMAFGKSIGQENLAIWFWRWEKNIPEMEKQLKKVQSHLKELSFYTGVVDGLQSPTTRRAIKNYQESVGLIPDGKLSLSLLLSLRVSHNTSLSNYVDIPRNIKYCKKYNLEPSKSPYVVVTTTYPALSSDVNDSLIVRLNDLQADEVSELLGVLGDQVVLGRLDQEVIDSESYWRTWETVADRLFNNLKVAASYIDKVTFEINTKFFKLKIEGSS